MAETNGFVRIMPDSTGKRIAHSVMVEVSYDNGTIPFLIGDILTASTSLLTGTVYKIEGTTAAGLLHIAVPDPVPNTIVFVVGENLQVNTVTYAKAATTGFPFYYQQTHTVGFKNPLNGWDIQDNGSGLVEFPEGAPQFDAFGKMLVAQQTTMAEYLNKYEMDVSNFTNFLNGTATITHEPSSSGIVFSTGTASGDKAERISDQYHPYQLGKGRLIEITCACGDTGKANVNRHWGYADNNDGILFSMVGTVLNIQLRSSVTGTVIKTYVPRTEWNGDRLDGSLGVFNASGVTLDVSKDNIYWIDFQWLGAGRVRWGIVYGGKRIVCHTIDNANQNSRSYMRTGSLPVYFEQVNSGTAASTSEFRLWCCVVKTGGAFDVRRNFHSIPSEIPTISKSVSGTDLVPVFSIRSKQQFNGIDNRMSSFIDSLDVLSLNSPIQVAIIEGGTLTGMTFSSSAGDSAIEYDTTSTAISGGTIVDTFYVMGNSEKTVDLTRIYNFNGHIIHRKADITQYHVVTIAARLISPGSSYVESSATLIDV